MEIQTLSVGSHISRTNPHFTYSSSFIVMSNSSSNTNLDLRCKRAGPVHPSASVMLSSLFSVQSPVPLLFSSPLHRQSMYCYLYVFLKACVVLYAFLKILYLLYWVRDLILLSLFFSALITVLTWYVLTCCYACWVGFPRKQTMR